MGLIRVYSQGNLYGEYEFYLLAPFKRRLSNLPKDAYIRLPLKDPIQTRWYRADFTPVLLADVPKEYLTLSLILGD